MTGVVFYDPTSGQIYQSGQMPVEAAAELGRPYIVVEEYSAEIDSQFRVENGALVPIAPAASPA